MEDFIDPLYFLEQKYLDTFINYYNNWMSHEERFYFDDMFHYYINNRRELVCCFIALYDQDIREIPCSELFNKVFNREIHSDFRRAMQIRKCTKHINEFWYIFLKEIYSTL